MLLSALRPPEAGATSLPLTVVAPKLRRRAELARRTVPLAKVMPPKPLTLPLKVPSVTALMVWSKTRTELSVMLPWLEAEVRVTAPVRRLGRLEPRKARSADRVWGMLVRVTVVVWRVLSSVAPVIVRRPVPRAAELSRASVPPARVGPPVKVLAEEMV